MSRKFALVPAAGTGSRMGDDRPKQYLSLAGRPMIRHALDTLCGSPRISKVFVVLSAQDRAWDRFDWSDLGTRLSVLRCGGVKRADSVLNGLEAIAGEVGRDDWMLVHDAARPCLTMGQLEALLDQVSEDEVGGILAVPVADTLKRCGADRRIDTTVPREHLWQAQTPQMFRYGLLREALANGESFTDEAAAVEAMGHRPLLVASDSGNLKVTYPADLLLAERILQEGKAA
ncbi:MAG: 2-C-methyl-D-erythritol 4-phosphate cytidylyltransferase [Rhodocyclaceae bacterium]|nr:2-C-methyl-D-erythritol 4-phosphate cytidylyltransferase [Rhodocyclaceae bacterium]MCO5097353.1 2-C-methyl-D-erythritol 4-phosphate cytidylyltransferase [Rhodocyclaceae bacterium]